MFTIIKLKCSIQSLSHIFICTQRPLISTIEFVLWGRHTYPWYFATLGTLGMLHAFFSFPPIADLLSLLLISLFSCVSCGYSSSLCSGHLPPSRGVWDGHADRGDHREPLLPGEQCPTEPLSRDRAGASVRGGDGLDPEASSGCSGDTTCASCRFGGWLLSLCSTPVWVSVFACPLPPGMHSCYCGACGFPGRPYGIRMHGLSPDWPRGVPVTPWMFPPTIYFGNLLVSWRCDWLCQLS